MSLLDAQLAAALSLLEQNSLRRILRPVNSAHGTAVDLCGHPALMLCSNNYLDLANHPALKRAALEAIEKYGVGAGASRLIAGSLEPVHELERKLADFKRTEAALVFGSGYLANVGVISAVCGPTDVILSDELNHASLIDGCRLSRAAIHVYRHREVDHLEQLLREHRDARLRLIVTDSVFSMDGDLAPLGEIVELASKYEASILVDEAHAVGVFGNGRGLIAELDLNNQVDIQIGTLSKALGAYGAYAAGSRTLIDFLINRARSFIYTTGLPPAMASAASAALRIIEEEPERIRRLWDNAAFLRDELRCAGFVVAPTGSPIIPVMLG